MTVPFTSYGQPTAGLQYNYASPDKYPLWTGHTKLHYWVMIAFEDADGGVVESEGGSSSLFDTINSVNNYAQWFSYGAQSDNGAFATGATPPASAQLLGPSFSADPWQEVTVALSDDRQAALDAGGFPVPEGTSCSTGNACKIGVQLTVPAAMPEGGSRRADDDGALHQTTSGSSKRTIRSARAEDLRALEGGDRLRGCGHRASGAGSHQFDPTSYIRTRVEPPAASSGGSIDPSISVKLHRRRYRPGFASRRPHCPRPAR